MNSWMKKTALVALWHFDWLLAPTKAQIRFLFESLWKEGTRPDHPL